MSALVVEILLSNKSCYEQAETSCYVHGVRGGMACYQLPAIDPFDFGKPAEWTRWIRRFERFRQASGLAERSEESQVNTLIYSMGDRADDLLRSFALSEQDAKKYDVVKEKFEGHFIKRRNVVFERARFNSRKQQEGESIDDFITDLFGLAEHCSYATLHDELVRDRIVVGILDKALSERMQLQEDLTLEKAVKQARQSEQVKRQQPIVRGQARDEANVEFVRGARKPQGWNQSRGKTKDPPSACTRCGKRHLPGRERCPAREAVCHKCGKRGHYKSMCKTKQGSIEIVGDETPAEAFLEVINEPKTAPTKPGTHPWDVRVTLNDRDLNFEIDTGADVTVIPQSAYSIDRDGPLRPAGRKLIGPARQPLIVQGCFRGRLRRKGTHIYEDICHSRSPPTPTRSSCNRKAGSSAEGGDCARGTS